MTKFVSKWKKEGDKLSDIANLDFPHTVQNMDKEDIGVIDTVEEAEALLDWYRNNYDHGMITQTLVKEASGRRKLRGAMERKLFLEAKAARHAARLAEFEKAEAKSLSDKEARRTARTAMRDQAAIAAYLPQKQSDIDDAISRVHALAIELRNTPVEMSRTCIDEIGRIAGAMTSAVGSVRQHQYGVATSRLFAVHCNKTTPKQQTQKRTSK